jgi:hypothetical protein
MTPLAGLAAIGAAVVLGRLGLHPGSHLSEAKFNLQDYDTSRKFLIPGSFKRRFRQPQVTCQQAKSAMRDMGESLEKAMENIEFATREKHLLIAPDLDPSEPDSLQAMEDLWQKRFNDFGAIGNKLRRECKLATPRKRLDLNLKPLHIPNTVR